MTRTMWVALALLCAVGFLVMARRASETRSSKAPPDGEGGRDHRNVSLEDDINWDELEKAEDEIRDLDPQANPDEGFEGDDWGPGTSRKPPLV